VYADPSNAEARALAADAFEQLGYLTESATWRNAYLLGAQELRNGVQPARPRQPIDAEYIKVMPATLVFDYLGTTLNGPRAGTAKMVANWRFTDTKENLVSTLDHAALTYLSGKTAATADVTVSTTRSVFNAIVLRQRTFADAQQRGDMKVTGNAARLTELMSYFDDFDPAFNIVEPRRDSAKDK
jgi:alkyl sulfatase BDS1-like metallo-beta-lactamase superfamily hydrolase